MTGVPGVAAVTAGPGITNTITAVKNAQMAQSPVILLGMNEGNAVLQLIIIGGAAATMLKGRGALQDIDQMALLQPICKYCATCASVSDIAPTLRKAFQEVRLSCHVYACSSGSRLKVASPVRCLLSCL